MIAQSPLRHYLENIRAGAQELLNHTRLEDYQAELVLDLLQFANAALELEGERVRRCARAE